MKNRLSLLFIILFSSFCQAAVWTNKNHWNDYWETQYSAWVEAEWKENIFLNPNSEVYGIPTDCADASYIMRILFSYKNNLPFVIKNPNHPGHFISNSSNKFDFSKDPVQRLQLFIKNLSGIVSSATLAEDTYPVAINRDYFRAGIIYVEPNSHSYQIKQINPNGVATSLSSTTPQVLRILQKIESFPLFQPSDFKNHKDGYRAFKQPQHYNMDEATIPGYSVEQFSLSESFKDDILSFDDALTDLLKLTDETLHQKVERALINLCDGINGRAYFIRDTYIDTKASETNCMSEDKYEKYSTPARDKRLTLIFQYLYRKIYLSANYHPEETPYSKILDFIFKGENSKIPQVTNWCRVEAFGNLKSTQKLDLRTVWESVESHRLVSDPNASFAERWGLEEYRQKCPAY